MSNSGQAGGRSKSKRRGRRRPKRNKRSRPYASREGTASRGSIESQAEESSSKKVFIYTYTIRKGG